MKHKTYFCTINGDKGIKNFSQNFLNYTRIQLILSHINTVVIHIVIVILDRLVIILLSPSTSHNVLVLFSLCTWFRLGNPKAATHAAEKLQCWTL